MAIESPYRKGNKGKTVTATLDVEAWEILKDVKSQYELKSLSAAIRMLSRLANK